MSVRMKKELIEGGMQLRAAPQQFAVEAEAALPGGLRDEVRLFYTEAQAEPAQAEAVGSRLTVSGRVNFRALYAQGDLTRVRCAEGSGDFSRVLTIAPGEGSAAYTPHCEITSATARVFNGRLLLRAEMNVTAQADAARQVNAVTQVEEDGAQVLSQTLELQQCVGGGESSGLVRGEFELAPALQAEEALLAGADARVEDIIGGADGRATVTGTIDLTVCHASRMPGRPLVYTQHSMPFEQTVTLSGEMGDALSASAQATDAAVALEGKEDERILRAEVSLKVGVQALREQRQSVAADVFASTGDQLIPSGERVTYRSASVNEQTAESGRLQLILPEGTPRIKTVLAAFVQPVLVGASAQGGKLNADMLLRATLIYMTEDSGIPVAYTAEEPARMVFAADTQPEDVLTLSALRVEPSAVAGDRAEIRYVISLRAEGTRYGQAFVVTEVAQEPAPAAESVLAMYRTQPDERLWDVMKRYRLPRESLLALNEQLTADEEETLPEGTCVIAYKR